MEAIIRRLSAPVVFTLVIAICCWWAILANIISVMHPAPGDVPRHDFTDRGMLVLVVLELVGLAVIFRVGRIRNWPFGEWGFQPSWRATGAGVLLVLVLYLTALSCLFVLIEFLALIAMIGCGRIRGWSFSAWKQPSSPATTGPDILLCLALYLMVWAGNRLAMAICPGTAATHLPLTSHLSVPFLLLLVLVNPVFEETVYGFIIQSLQHCGIWIAILASALFRAGLHTYLGFPAVFGNLSLGLIFGFIYWKWRRLWPLFIAHGLFDLFMSLKAAAP